MFQKSTVTEKIHPVKKCTVKVSKCRQPLLPWLFCTFLVGSYLLTYFWKTEDENYPCKRQWKKFNFRENRISLYFFFYTLSFSEKTIFQSHLYMVNFHKTLFGHYIFCAHNTWNSLAENEFCLTEGCHFLSAFSNHLLKISKTSTYRTIFFNTDTLH